jgi:hypothetical protein
VFSSTTGLCTTTHDDRRRRQSTSACSETNHAAFYEYVENFVGDCEPSPIDRHSLITITAFLFSDSSFLPVTEPVSFHVRSTTHRAHVPDSRRNETFTTITMTMKK